MKSLLQFCFVIGIVSSIKIHHQPKLVQKQVFALSSDNSTANATANGTVNATVQVQNVTTKAQLEADTMVKKAMEEY